MKHSTFNQRTIQFFFRKAKIVGDGTYALISNCRPEQTAYLFEDEILMAAKNLRCGTGCKNDHIVRKIKDPQLAIPAQPFIDCGTPQARRQ